jgi:hypothetical protein
MVVDYLDNSERDEVTLWMTWDGGTYSGGTPRTNTVDLSDEQRRAFINAVEPMTIDQD